MKLVKKEPVADEKIIVTITGHWDDGVCITNTTSWFLAYAEQVFQRLVILTDFFESREELRGPDEEYGYIDIRADYDEAAEKYLTRKYGFDKHEIRTKTVAASFYEEIYEIAPRSEEYYIHTITNISLRVNGEEYDLEWEPSEVRGIIADFFALES
jgi:hypothetical protein